MTRPAVFDAPSRSRQAPEGADQPARRRVLAAVRPPAPLAALLIVTAVLGVAWSLITPAFQAPDENAHFAYLQSLGEHFALPGDARHPKFSSEQVLADSDSNAEQAAAQVDVPMEWSARAYERWRARESRLPQSAHGDGGGPNPASSNPPLYYLYETPFYRLGENGDLFTRLQIARLGSVVWLLVTVLAVWALAGEVFGRNRLLQLAAGATAGLAPMMGFISASLNPDAMLFAAWSLSLWLGVRILRRGITPWNAGVFFLVVGAAFVVKATSLALLPGAVFVLAAAVWRRVGGGGRAVDWLRRAVRPAAAAAVGLLVTAGAWLIVSHQLHRAAAAQVSEVSSATASFIPREFASYVWQFYLPRLPGIQSPSLRPTETIGVYDVWLKTAWASFGWLEVNFPGWVYLALAAVTALVTGLALRVLWLARRQVDRLVVVFLALVGVALIAGLHWTEYWWMKSGLGPFTTGRYLLPLVGIAGLAVAAAVSSLRPAHRAPAVALTVGGLFVLDLFSLGLMLERFYA